MSHGWFTCECGNHYHETEHPSKDCPACADKEEEMSLRDDMYDPEYPVLEKGDVAYISNVGCGLTGNNRGLYCVIEEYSPTGYYGSAGYRVSKYDHDLVAHNYERDWVGVKSFGDKPMILFNIHEEHTVDEEHTVVAVGSKEEADKVLGIDRSAVHKPVHYDLFEDVEAIEVIARSIKKEEFRGYCFGNLLKYRLRCGKKDNVEQELAKADKYKELYEKYKDFCYE